LCIFVGWIEFQYLPQAVLGFRDVALLFQQVGKYKQLLDGRRFVLTVEVRLDELPAQCHVVRSRLDSGDQLEGAAAGNALPLVRKLAAVTHVLQCSPPDCSPVRGIEGLLRLALRFTAAQTRTHRQLALLGRRCFTPLRRQQEK